ncbi:hypothetical protein [Aquimarina agarivorans]|uniref:hypothetical protein n=1 Tax=Aquimarina agarivorans TaxID=980584 RepID=UPI000248FC5F|nr:hypothetical protein [Aquimarina agarivorans]
MSVFGYQSDVVQVSNSAVDDREVSELEIRPEDINPIIEHTPNRNEYVKTKDNIILCKDIRLKRVGGLGTINEIVLVFPVPLIRTNADYVGEVFSNEGNYYRYRMNSDGHIRISGNITSLNEEIIFNMMPYVAASPVRYIATDFGRMITP